MNRRPGYVDHIPVSAPLLAGNEWAYLRQVIQSTRLSMGPYTERFEAAWAAYTETDHCLTCSSGTTALHLALLALGVKPGDEVLVPTLTFIATANAVTYCGATPVFIDSDPLTWNLDATKLAEAITPRTVGIIAVHLYGQPCDMDAIQAVADKHNLWVVEDAAEAHGAVYKGQKVGGLADIATWSYYGNKILTMGEGGAITTNRADIAERVRLLRGQGMDPQRRYYHPVVGYNYRLTDLQAAVGLAQLEKIDEYLGRRGAIKGWYCGELLKAWECGYLTIQTVPSHLADTETWPIPWLFTVVLADHINRDAVAAYMAERGIETRPVFVPCHMQPPYRTRYSTHVVEGRLVAADVVHNAKRPVVAPVAERLARQGLSLPTHAGMDAIHVEQVCETLIAAIEAQRGGDG